MLSYWVAGIGGPASGSDVPAKISVGTVSFGYVPTCAERVTFQGSIAKAALSVGVVFAAMSVPPPPFDQPATPWRLTSSFPARGLPERVFSPRSVTSASRSAAARAF